jgi:hypothetical protein
VIGVMIFYDDNGELIRDIRGLMLQVNAKALGLPQMPKVPQLARVTHPGLSTGSADARGDLVEYLGRGVVRSIIKDSDRGILANCHVTQGTMKRNDRVRVIREGVVVFPPADQPVRLESLERHNQGIAEIGEGYECAITITGFDGFSVGDVIEAFRLDADEDH